MGSEDISIEQIFVSLTLGLAALITVFGNGLVLLAWLKEKELQSPQNVFIFSLSIVDFLVGISILPLDILVELAPPNNLYLCQFRLVGVITLCTCSIFHLTAIAWDRYKIVVYGFAYIQRRSFKTLAQVVAAMWILSFWIAMPPLLDPEGWFFAPNGGCFYNGGLNWVVHGTVGIFLLPTILMVKLYTSLYFAVQQRFRKRMEGTTKNLQHSVEETSESGQSDCRLTVSPSEMEKKNKKALLRRERKVLRMLSIIVAVFLLSWLPFFTVHVAKEFIPFFNNNRKAFKYLSYLGHANSGANPIIYAIFNQEFRLAFTNILTCGKFRK